ncbi:hypothetical protein KCV01_g20607, partial [Aureobasidium melanogenum]
LLDNLGGIEEVGVCAIDAELRREGVFMARDEMHMGQLSITGTPKLGSAILACIAQRVDAPDDLDYVLQLENVERK